MSALVTPVGSSTPAVESTPAATAATPVVPTTTAPAAPSQATPPVVDPRAEINTLAAEFGFDPTHFASFNDVASAKAAIRLYAEQTAQQGMTAAFAPREAAGAIPPAPAESAPQVSAAPVAVKPLDLKAFGLDDDEPAAKAFRALETQLAASQQQSQQLAAKFESMEKSAQESTKQRLQAEAASVVDGFKDARYGVGNQRTAAQKVSQARLYDLADAMAIADYQAGRQISPLSARLFRARLIDVQDGAPAPLAQTSPASAAALPQIGAPPSAPMPIMKINEKWADNPALRAALGL